MPVGHTHEDIDQVFSKVSDTICKNGCEFIPGMNAYVTHSDKTNLIATNIHLFTVPMYMICCVVAIQILLVLLIFSGVSKYMMKLVLKYYFQKKIIKF